MRSCACFWARPPRQGSGWQPAPSGRGLCVLVALTHPPNLRRDPPRRLHGRPPAREEVRRPHRMHRRARAAAQSETRPRAALPRRDDVRLPGRRAPARWNHPHHLQQDREHERAGEGDAQKPSRAERRPSREGRPLVAPHALGGTASGGEDASRSFPTTRRSGSGAGWLRRPMATIRARPPDGVRGWRGRSFITAPRTPLQSIDRITRFRAYNPHLSPYKRSGRSWFQLRPLSQSELE